MSSTNDCSPRALTHDRSTDLLKNRPIPTTPSHPIGILSLAVPAFVEVEPAGQHQVGLLGEAIAVCVGENEFAMVVEEDFERAVVDVAVAAGTNPEHIMSQSRPALGVGNEMVEVEPDFVGTSGSTTAPTVPPQNFSFLSFGSVTVARVEADSLVLDR